jgi:hypothetical protein
LWAKTIEETKLLLASGYSAEASLDYDLGEGDGLEGLEGYDQMLWMAEHDAWLTEGERSLLQPSWVSFLHAQYSPDHSRVVTSSTFLWR